MKKVNLLYPELSYKVTGLIFKTHNESSRYCSEKQFCDFLEKKFIENNVKYVREKNINSDIKGDRVDFCVEDKIVIECKAKAFVTR